jgi:hypothetical protein
MVGLVLRAGFFHLDILSPYCIAYFLGAFLRRLTYDDFLDNPLLFSHYRLFSHFSDLDNDVVFAVGISHWPVHGAPFDIDPLVTQRNGLFDWLFTNAPIDTHPARFYGSFSDNDLLLGNGNCIGIVGTEVLAV